MRSRTLAASALLAAGLTAGLAGVAAAVEPDDTVAVDGPVIVTCESGVMDVRAATPAERAAIEEDVEGDAVRGEQVRAVPARPGPAVRPVDGAPCSAPLVAGRGGVVHAVPALPAR